VIKKDIVDTLHGEHGGMSLQETDHHVNALLGLLGEAIQWEPVTIANFGKFRQKERKVREIRMPDGTPKLTSGADRIQFIPSQALKTQLNQKDESDS